MSNLEDTTRQIAERWSGKTLATLRLEAEQELNGTAYEAFRPSNEQMGDGPRLGLVICVTGAHELALVERTFSFSNAGAERNWATYTLAEMWVDSAAGEGLGYQDLKRRNKRVAVALCGSSLDKIKLLERIFCLPA